MGPRIITCGRCGNDYKISNDKISLSSSNFSIVQVKCPFCNYVKITSLDEVVDSEIKEVDSVYSHGNQEKK